MSEEFKEWMRKNLKDGVATIVFEKTNGDMRTMRCTLDPQILPIPKDNGEQWDVVEEKEDKPNQVVWDVEADNWRSFRWETLTSYAFDNQAEKQLSLTGTGL